MRCGPSREKLERRIRRLEKMLRTARQERDAAQSSLKYIANGDPVNMAPNFWANGSRTTFNEREMYGVGFVAALDWAKMVAREGLSLKERK